MPEKSVSQILIEAIGGCWHETHPQDECQNWCNKCQSHYTSNPDFSQWQHFGRLLKIAERLKYRIRLITGAKRIEIDINLDHHSNFHYQNIDQIPSLVAEELARILEEEKNA